MKSDFMRMTAQVLCVLAMMTGSVPALSASGAPKSISNNVKIALIGDDFIGGAGLFKAEDRMAYLIANDPSRHSVNISVKEYTPQGGSSATAVSQIDQIIAERPDIAVVAVGLNDALTGIDPDVIYSNLDNTLRELDRSRIYTLFITVQAPTTVDQNYAMGFNSIFSKLAAQHPNAVVMEQFYNPIYGSRDFSQLDQIHPNKFGVRKLFERLQPVLVNAMVFNAVEMRRCSSNPAICHFKKVRD